MRDPRDERVTVTYKDWNGRAPVPEPAAGNSEPFISEIRAFAFGFAPRGWAPCDGRTLDIAEYQPLFSLIGWNHGGDRRSTFALPDLRRADTPDLVSAIAVHGLFPLAEAAHE
jgi:Phage Tail Collar Domain